MAAASLAIAIIYFRSAMIGTMLVAGMAGLALAALAFRWPILLLSMLILVAPFNYGRPLGGAVIKLSEAVSAFMFLTIVLRLAAGDPTTWNRIRRGGHVLAVVILLATLAIATAVRHPHFFNVRYEIQNYIALIYGMLFFRRRHGPLLALLFIAALGFEAASALILKFALHMTGINFAQEGGGAGNIALTTKELKSFAGGINRISGTLGHKNLLAGFIVLLLPLASLELLRRPAGWLPAVIILGPVLATLGLTDSMTGWTATLLMAVVALIYLRRFDYLLFLLLCLMPVAIFALYEFGDTIFFRMQQLFGGSQRGLGTVNSRVQIYEINRLLIDRYFWFGIGRENYAMYGKTFYGHGHNLFLMKAIEMGVPGGLMFLTLIAGSMIRTWRTLTFHGARLSRNGQYYRYLGVWLGCLGFLAMNMLDYSYSNFALGPLFMTLLGILLATSWDVTLTAPDSQPAVTDPV